MTRRRRRLVALLLLAALTLAVRQALGSSVSSGASHWVDAMPNSPSDDAGSDNAESDDYEMPFMNATPDFSADDAESYWVDETSAGAARGGEMSAPMQIPARPGDARRQPHWVPQPSPPEDAPIGIEASREFGSGRIRSEDIGQSIQERRPYPRIERGEPIDAVAALQAESRVAQVLRQLGSQFWGKGATGRAGKPALAEQANMRVTGRWVGPKDFKDLDIPMPEDLPAALEQSLFGIVNSTCREIEGHTRNATRQAESDAQCLRLFTALFVSELAPVGEPDEALEKRAMDLEHKLFQRFPRVLVVLAHRSTLRRATQYFRVSTHFDVSAFLPVALRHFAAASEGRADAGAGSWAQRMVAAARRVISRIGRRTVLSSRSVIEALTVFTRQYYTNPHHETDFNATVSGPHRPLDGKRWATRALSAATRSRRVREALFGRIVYMEVRPTLVRLLRTAASELESFDVQNVVNVRALLSEGYGIGGANLPAEVSGLLESGFQLYFAHADFVIKRDMLYSVLVIPEHMPSTEAVLFAAVNAAGPVLQKVLQLLVGYIQDEGLRATLQALFSRIRPLSTRKMQDLVNTVFDVPHLSTPELGVVLGSASIAQVHLARWYSAGKDRVVVVKIRRPNLRERVDAELRVVDLLAEQRPKLRDYLSQMKQTVLQELDFELEARNWDVGQALYERPEKGLYVPQCRMAFPRESPNVLILNRAYGVTVKEMLETRHPDEQMCVLAHRLEALTERWFEEALFGSGRFHGDPHPGNMMYEFMEENPVKSPLSLIDFGHMHELNMQAQLGILLFAMGVQVRSTTLVIQAIADLANLKANNPRLRRLQTAVHVRLGRPAGDRVLGDADGKQAQSVTAIAKDLMELVMREGLLLPAGVLSFIRARIMLEQTLIILGAQYPQCGVSEPEDVYRNVARRHMQTYREGLRHMGSIFNQRLLLLVMERVRYDRDMFFRFLGLVNTGVIVEAMAMRQFDMSMTVRQFDLSTTEHLDLTRRVEWVKGRDEPSAMAIAEHAAAVAGNGDAARDELLRRARKSMAILPPEPEPMGTYHEPDVLSSLRTRPRPRVTDPSFIAWKTEQRMRKVRKPRAQIRAAAAAAAVDDDEPLPPAGELSAYRFYRIDNVDTGSSAFYDRGALYCIRDADGSVFFFGGLYRESVAVAIDHAGALRQNNRLPAKLRAYPTYIDKTTIAGVEAGDSRALLSAPSWALPREAPRAHEKGIVGLLAANFQRQMASSVATLESADVFAQNLLADIAAERAADERDLDFSLLVKASASASAEQAGGRLAATGRRARFASAAARAASAPETFLARVRSLTHLDLGKVRGGEITNPELLPEKLKDFIIDTLDRRNRPRMAVVPELDMFRSVDAFVDGTALTLGVRRPPLIRGMDAIERVSRSVKVDPVSVGGTTVPVPAFSGTRVALTAPLPELPGGSYREPSVLAAAARRLDEIPFEPSSEPPGFLSRTAAAEDAKTRAADAVKWIDMLQAAQASRSFARGSQSPAEPSQP